MYPMGITYGQRRRAINEMPVPAAWHFLVLPALTAELAFLTLPALDALAFQRHLLFLP